MTSSEVAAGGRRYFFHLHDASGLTEDHEGRLLGGPESARTAAIADARAIIADDARRGVVDLRSRIDVTDDAGAPVARIEFAEAVTVLT